MNSLLYYNENNFLISDSEIMVNSTRTIQYFETTKKKNWLKKSLVRVKT